MDRGNKGLRALVPYQTGYHLVHLSMVLAFAYFGVVILLQAMNRTDNHYLRTSWEGLCKSDY